MKLLIALLALAGAAGLCAPRAALAQGAPARPYARRYNPQTVETVSGQVLAVERVSGPRGFQGVHLTLQTATGKLSVHLGPGWFMDRQALKIAPHDTLEVTGSRVTYRGETVLVAERLTKDGQTLVLRDAQGVPLWSGLRHR